MQVLPSMRAQHPARRMSVIAAITGASVLAGLTGCTSAAPAHQPPPPGASSSISSGAPSPGPLSPPVAVDAAYENAVETHVAGSLHRTVAQLRSELRANLGAGLENLAKPLGLAEDQLARVVVAGLDGAADAASRSGRWTARQAQDEKMYWASQSSSTLVTGVSSWFVNG